MTVHLRTATAIALLSFGCNDPPDGDSTCVACSTLVDDSSLPLECNDLITWDSWAHGFFLNNCTSCHSSTLPEEARQKATAGVNFDTYAGVVEYAVDIEYRVWSAEPKYLMPPNIKLSYEDRDTLRLWIECGLKEH